MCIIVYKPSMAKMPSMKTLKTCWENNSDGAGYMYPQNGQVIIKKGFMTWNDFKKSLTKDMKKISEFAPMVLHFRISTQGGVNPECTHPFPLSPHMEDLRKLKTKCNIGIAHNGVIDITSNSYNKTITYSDTMEFITDYLTLIIRDKNYYKDSNTLLLIERLIQSKMAIMDGDGHVELIGEFILDNGCYYSNSYYKESRYKFTNSLRKTKGQNYHSYNHISNRYYDTYDNAYDYDSDYYWDWGKNWIDYIDDMDSDELFKHIKDLTDDELKKMTLDNLYSLYYYSIAALESQGKKCNGLCYDCPLCKICNMLDEVELHSKNLEKQPLTNYIDKKEK